MTTLTIGSHNVRRGRAQFRNFAVVINKQEMETAEAHRRLQGKKRYWHTPHPSGPPAPRDFLTISGRKSRCRLVESGWEKVHGGEAGETPSRGIEWAVISVGRKNDLLIDLNPWPINGGWKPRKFGRDEAAWRALLHDAYVSTMRVLIDQLRDRYPDAEVVVAGDLNWPERVGLPGLRLALRNGVDHIYVSSGLRKRRVWRLPRWGSDHRPIKVRVTWKKR